VVRVSIPVTYQDYRYLTGIGYPTPPTTVSSLMEVKDESEKVARNEEAVEFSFDKVIHSLPLEAKESISKGIQSETRRCCFRSSEVLVVSLVNIAPNQK
jgi:hypothetical protein